jgi:hypothetical protein
MSSRQPVCFLLSQNIGFFAQLTYCVLIVKACLEKNIEPYFFLNNDISVQRGLGANALSYYFEHRNLTREQQIGCYVGAFEKNGIKIGSRWDLNFFARGAPTREISNELVGIDEGRGYFTNTFVLKGWVSRLVDEFWEGKLGNGTVGVHFRGKDKFGTEADPVGYGDVFKVLRQQLSEGYARILVCTDDPEFNAACKAEFGFRVVNSRSSFDRINHFEDTGKNFRKNAEALIDCLLLSRCDLLIKTPSLLSAWSVVFNPNLRVICIGRPFQRPYNETGLEGYGYWPEKCLHPLDAEPLRYIGLRVSPTDYLRSR